MGLLGDVSGHLTEVARSRFGERPGVVEVSAHREERRPRKVLGARRPPGGDLVDHPHRLVGRPPAEDERRLHPHLGPRVAGEALVAQCLERSFDVVVVLLVEVRCSGEQFPEQRQPACIAVLLLERKGTPAERDHLVGRVGLAGEVAQIESHRSRQHRPGTVTRRLDTFDDRVCLLDSRRHIEASGYPGGLELEREVEPVRAYKLGCASEQPGSGPVVLAVDRPVAGGGEPGGGAFGQCRVGLSEFSLVAGWLVRGGSRRSRRVRRVPGRVGRASRRSGRAGRRGRFWGARRRLCRGSAGGGSGSRRRRRVGRARGGRAGGAQVRRGGS